MTGHNFLGPVLTGMWRARHKNTEAVLFQLIEKQPCKCFVFYRVAYKSVWHSVIPYSKCLAMFLCDT